MIDEIFAAKFYNFKIKEEKTANSTMDKLTLFNLSTLSHIDEQASRYE